MTGALRDAASSAGIELLDFLRAEDGRYWSYLCGSEAYCPAEGVPYDPGTRPASAAMARAGSRVLGARAAVAARVAPVGGLAAESMRQATRRAEQHAARRLAKVRAFSPIGAARRLLAAEGLAAVGEMIARYRGGGRFTSDYEIARLTVALRDLRVRDDAWARGHMAAPAALPALAVWQSGNGVMQARPTRLRPVAREPRAAAAPASVGPASEGGERS